MGAGITIVRHGFTLAFSGRRAISYNGIGVKEVCDSKFEQNEILPFHRVTVVRYHRVTTGTRVFEGTKIVLIQLFSLYLFLFVIFIEFLVFFEFFYYFLWTKLFYRKVCNGKK